jgi:5-methylcytosine-specific restriction protein B
MPPADRDAPMQDPWAFRAAAASTPQDWPSIRHSLEYLAWPGCFEPIVASDHRRQIRDAFAYRIGGSTGTGDESIARDLHSIRQLVDEEAAHRVDFYRPPYVHQWSKPKDVGQRAWLVRSRQGGAELVAGWQEKGPVSLAAVHLGGIPVGSDLAQVRAAVETGYEHEDYAQCLALAHEYHAFLTRMKADDLIVTTTGDGLRVGVISGEPEYALDGVEQLRRGANLSDR